MKELINTKIFENEVKLIQTDEGNYEVVLSLRYVGALYDEAFRAYKVYVYENAGNAFSRYSNIISDYLMGGLDLS